jgi:hypothetical protein
MWLLYEQPDTKFDGVAMRFMDIRKRVYELPKLGAKAEMVRRLVGCACLCEGELNIRHGWLLGEGWWCRIWQMTLTNQCEPPRPTSPPQVCIPTTSGTGSEVTPFSVVTDEVRRAAGCSVGGFGWGIRLGATVGTSRQRHIIHLSTQPTPTDRLNSPPPPGHR